VGGEFETAYELNTALSYVAIDMKLTLGVELLVEYETAREIEEGESDYEYETTVMLGPSVLYKPTRNTHLGLVTFFGLTHDAPTVEAFFIFGIDWEPFASKRSASKEERTRPIRRNR